MLDLNTNPQYVVQSNMVEKGDIFLNGYNESRYQICWINRVLCYLEYLVELKKNSGIKFLDQVLTCPKRSLVGAHSSSHLYRVEIFLLPIRQWEMGMT